MPKCYAVAVGKQRGIYNTWEDCEAQTRGVSGAVFKKLASREHAQEWLAAHAHRGLGHPPPSYTPHAPAHTPVLAPAPAHVYAPTPPAHGALSGSDGPVPSALPASTPVVTAPVGPTHFLLRFDGGARGNPGPGGTGSIIYAVLPDGGRVRVWSKGTHLPHCTNNESEYTGMLHGLRWAVDSGMQAELRVEGDSKLVINHMTGVEQCRAGNLQPLRAEALGLARQLGRVTYRHIYREENTEADALGNVANDTRQTVENTQQSQLAWCREVMRGGGMPRARHAPRVEEDWVRAAGKKRGRSASGDREGGGGGKRPAGRR